MASTWSFHDILLTTHQIPMVAMPTWMNLTSFNACFLFHFCGKSDLLLSAELGFFALNAASLIFLQY